MASSLEGVAELSRKLDLLPRKVAGLALRRAVRYAGQPVLDYAKATIPVGTEAHKVWLGSRTKGGGVLVAPGFASRTVKAVTRLSKDKRSASVMIGVGRKAFYATQFVELGTSKTPRDPFLRPALQSTIPQQTSRLAEKLRIEILKVAKS